MENVTDKIGSVADLKSLVASIAKVKETSEYRTQTALLEAEKNWASFPDTEGKTIKDYFRSNKTPGLGKDTVQRSLDAGKEGILFNKTGIASRFKHLGAFPKDGKPSGIAILKGMTNSIGDKVSETLKKAWMETYAKWVDEASPSCNFYGCKEKDETVIVLTGTIRSKDQGDRIVPFAFCVKHAELIRNSINDNLTDEKRKAYAQKYARIEKDEKLKAKEERLRAEAKRIKETRKELAKT